MLNCARPPVHARPSSHLLRRNCARGSVARPARPYPRRHRGRRLFIRRHFFRSAGQKRDWDRMRIRWFVAAPADPASRQRQRARRRSPRARPFDVGRRYIHGRRSEHARQATLPSANGFLRARDIAAQKPTRFGQHLRCLFAQNLRIAGPLVRPPPIPCAVRGAGINHPAAEGPSIAGWIATGLLDSETSWAQFGPGAIL